MQGRNYASTLNVNPKKFKINLKSYYSKNMLHINDDQSNRSDTDKESLQ